MDRHLKRQNLLHDEATKIVKDLDLVKVLEKCGEVKFVGSYELGLMSWEDIDVVVKCEPDYDCFLGMVDTLFKKKRVYNISQLMDFRKSIYPGRPQGLYCGVTYLGSKNAFWKIDIWFLPKSPAEDVVESVRGKLNDENKKIILAIKNEMREKTEEGKKVSGVDVYKAVLENGVVDFDGFRDYMRKQGRDL